MRERGEGEREREAQKTHKHTPRQGLKINVLNCSNQIAQLTFHNTKEIRVRRKNRLCWIPSLRKKNKEAAHFLET